MKQLSQYEKIGLMWRQSIDSLKLMTEYPPKFMNPHKKWIYSQNSPDSEPPHGKITVSRWNALPIPFQEDFIPAASGDTLYDMLTGFFEYSTFEGPEATWYLNFADRNLFGYYQGALFAQDEMQVMEHPILGSVRSWLEEQSLNAPKYHPNTQNASGSPTPYLFQGVERRFNISTDNNSEEERPHGLYGKRFMGASQKAIELATVCLIPPTFSNIIAISALSPRRGKYTRSQITKLFTTVYTGFMAARIESNQSPFIATSKPPRVIIHTGNWGCGAFGGNPTLIALIQLLAAKCAGIDLLVYHPLSNEKQYNHALKIITEELGEIMRNKGVMAALIQLEACGYEWGVSDGN
jgi:hypothetical protein